MKLESGRDVELKPLTMSQRVQCIDAVDKTVIEGGKVGLNALGAAKYLWACFGLGFKSMAEFDAFTPVYTGAEITEISSEVQEREEKGANPTIAV